MCRFWDRSFCQECWGITHVGPLFVPHFYLTVASVFFFAFHWKKQADTDFWQADLRHPFLSVFAVSNVLMTLAFVSIIAILYFMLPSRSLAFTLPALLKLYALKPVYWFILQFVIMAVFLSAPQKHCQAVAGGVQ